MIVPPIPPKRTQTTKAAWRSSRALSAARASVRSRWIQRHGATPAERARWLASAEKEKNRVGARAFLAELLFFAKPGVAADADVVARACASFSGGEGHASRRFGNREEEEEEEEEEDAFSERATWRALLAADDAAESARATVVASRVVAFALASLGEHDECALGANEAGALARAVIALTASPSVSKRVFFSRPSRRGGGVRITGETRSDAAEMLRAASISRRRCASTAKLLDLMWTRVVVLTESGTDSDSDGCTVSNAANAAFAAQLISLPRVWRRGGNPATTWPSSVATLFAMTREASSGGSSEGSSRVSFPDPPFAEDRRRGHSGYAAAWALGNLVEGASAGLETCGSRVEKWRAATRFAGAAASLLRRLPPGTTLSSSMDLSLIHI